MQIVSNEKPIGFEEAISIDRVKILCYRNRICRYCNTAFDIEKKGIYYWCGCEKDGEHKEC